MIGSLYNKVSSIKKVDSDEKIKMELYGVVTAFLLSTEIFKRNIQIKEFLDSSNEKFKNIRPYAYDSRTILIGKVLRIVEEESKLFNYNFTLDIKNYLKEIVFNMDNGDSLLEDTVLKRENSNKKVSKSINSKNYTDSLFKQFKRGE